MATDPGDGLDPNIVAALDDVLVPGACEPALLGRLRRLVANCLSDNYDQSDVLALIELGVGKSGDEAGAGDGA